MSLSFRRIAMLAAALLVSLAVGRAARALDVPLTVTETAGVDRTAEPVTTGVPLPKGVAKDAKAFSLTNAEGAAVPAQFRVLAPWPDGSVRVVLVDTQVTVPAKGAAKLTLHAGGAGMGVGGVIQIQGGQVNVQVGGGNAQVRVEVNGQAVGGGQVQVQAMVNGQPVAVSTGPKPATAIKYEEGPDAVTLNTGPLELTVSKTKFNLFQSLKLDGKELLGAGGARIVLTTEDGKAVTAGDVAPTEVKIEELGDLRTVICARGRFGDLHNKMMHYTCRITAYAGKPFVKVVFWLENDGRYGYVGAPEWFTFHGLSVDLPVKATAVKCEGVEAAKAFDLRQDNPKGKGDWKAFSFTITGDKEASGERASGQAAVTCPGGAINVAVKDFWQNYPKGLRLADGTLSLDLWPTWGHWPRECQGGRLGTAESARKSDPEMMAFCKPGCYAFPGGRHKRHEMIFDFGQARSMADTAATLDQPLMALATSQYYADCEALTLFAPKDFLPPDAAAAKQVERWNRWAYNVGDPKNPGGIEGTRKNCNFGPFYGLMDFADFDWADGVTSLHYDWPWIAMLEYVRLQERPFFDYAAEMVKYRIDFLQGWSDREDATQRALSPYERGSLYLHGGCNNGDSKPNPSHNWDRGPLWWYYFTGDQSAYDCVYRNCDIGLKLRQVDKHANDTEGKLLGDQTRASGWAIGCLCDAYDMTGDKKFLDWAGTLWKTHLRALWKKAGPNYGMVKGNVLQFYYPTHDLVMLHVRNQDPELLEYMRDLCKYCDDPKSWTTYQDDQAINMTNFYGYLAWVDKDPHMLERARQLFIEGITPNDRALTLFAGSGAYTKTCGKPLRNGHIYLWAERKLAEKK